MNVFLSICAVLFVNFLNATATNFVGIVSGINQETLTLFDTNTNNVTATIELKCDSLSAAITPDGKWIYAASYDEPSVSVIDRQTLKIVNTISTTAQAGAINIIVSPDGTRAYVLNHLSGFVTVIDTKDQTVLTNIFVSMNVGGITITPDSKTLYISDCHLGNVMAIDTETLTVVTRIFTGATPKMIAITADGKVAYVANLGSDTVSVVDVLTNTISSTLNFPAGSGPCGLNILPNGEVMYVMNCMNSTVTVLDLSTERFVTTIDLSLGSNPFKAAITPDGKTVYVINKGSNDVIAIDVETNTIASVFTPILGKIHDIVISPEIELSPPIELVGFQKVCKFATQTCIINVVCWQRPLSGLEPVSYRIYRNRELTDLVAIIDSHKPLRFMDQKRKKMKSETYYIVSVSEQGTLSLPSIITIK